MKTKTDKLSEIKVSNEVKEFVAKLENENDIYYTMLLLLTTRELKYVDALSLMYALDATQIKRLVDVFGGKTIYIPKKSELLDSLKTIMFIYYKDIKGMSLEAAKKMIDYNGIQNRRSFLASYKKLEGLIVSDGSVIPGVVHDKDEFRRIAGK